MGRAPCCEKVGLKRGRWTAEEDQTLTNYIHSHGEGSWRSLPKNAGLLRCGKSCRLRWINYLRSDLKRGNITPQEEETIVKLHTAFGNKWSSIAAQLPGRTDNEIKNYWNSHLSHRIYTFTKQSTYNQPLTTVTNIIQISSTASKRRSRRRQISQSYVSTSNQMTASSVQANPENDTSSQENNPEQKIEDGFCLDTRESVISDHRHDNDEKETDRELCFSMDKENLDLGPYEWLDSEIMRLANMLQSGDNFDPSGNNVIPMGVTDINEEREKGRSTNVSDHERENGSSASLENSNSGFDTDEWLVNWDFHFEGGVESCSDHDQWELNEMSIDSTFSRFALGNE